MVTTYSKRRAQQMQVGGQWWTHILRYVITVKMTRWTDHHTPFCVYLAEFRCQCILLAVLLRTRWLVDCFNAARRDETSLSSYVFFFLANGTHDCHGYAIFCVDTCQRNVLILLEFSHYSESADMFGLCENSRDRAVHRLRLVICVWWWYALFTIKL